MASEIGVNYRIEPAQPKDVVALRHAVLRPGKPVETAIFEGDDAATTLHFVARDLQDEIVGVVSYFANSYAAMPERKSLQLRGMATNSSLQRSGIGRILVQASVQSLHERQLCDLVWCNARQSAIGFYTRLGFFIDGAPFYLPHVAEAHRTGVLDLRQL